jgi:aminoglycoside/choline kinase family phosphotransferase
MDNHIDNLKELFFRTFNKEVEQINLLEASGSNRKYYRIQAGTISVIGTYNEDFKENRAFIAFSCYFLKKGISVPAIYAENLEKNVYLQSDLGDETLYSYLCRLRSSSEDFSKAVIPTYKQVLSDLLEIQLSGNEEFDYSPCYPRHSFDEQSIAWDLNYFKYYFLKLAQIPFDEDLLEKDFKTFTHFLLEADSSYFLYRDFQSRNIMMHENKLYYIDFQGGRKGALQYDVASLLYDAKADLPQEIREELLNHYIGLLQQKSPEQAAAFRNYFYGFVLIRLLQAMGSYGFRGFYERKQHFLQSIPYALKNLDYLLAHTQFPIEIPHLRAVLSQLSRSKTLQQYAQPKLTVTINSFSFKNDYPVDSTGNGGGFVFDCRCLPNPGRYERYNSLTGKDAPVIAYLEKEEAVNHYFESVKQLTDAAVKNYMERRFENLSISFGCTGGKHRSVYFAEKMQKHIRQTYTVNTKLNHLMQNRWEEDGK